MGSVLQAGVGQAPDRQAAINDKHGVTREQQDAFALRSHQRAVAAGMEGSFRDEIVPVTVETRRSSILVESDEGPRAETSLEALGNLRPAFSQGRSVTAGAAPRQRVGTYMAGRLGLNPIVRPSEHALIQKGGRRGLATIPHGGDNGVSLSVELCNALRPGYLMR